MPVARPRTQVWQAEITHWKLAGGTEVEVLNVIDDPSRFLVARDVGRVFRDTQPSTASRSPTSVAQAGSYGTDRWNEGEFFRSEITDYHLVTG